MCCTFTVHLFLDQPYFGTRLPHVGCHCVGEGRIGVHSFQQQLAEQTEPSADSQQQGLLPDPPELPQSLGSPLHCVPPPDRSKSVNFQQPGTQFLLLRLLE